MHWKNLLLQAVITFLAVFAGFLTLGPTTLENNPINHSLQSDMRTIVERLSKIEDALLSARHRGPPLSASPQKPVANLDELNAELLELKEGIANLEALIEYRFAELGQKGVPRRPPIAPGGPLPGSSGMQFQGPTSLPSDPTRWIRELPERKQQQVNEIFRTHARTVRDELAMTSGKGTPDPEQLHRIMEEADKELREKLRILLSDEEYQTFLDSLPKPPSGRP